MKLKGYIFTSLVFVNLTIGASTLRAEDYISTNKKNKEVLKVSIDQEEKHVVDTTGSSLDFFENINLLNNVVLLSFALGVFLSFYQNKKTINKLNKKPKKYVKIVSRETIPLKRAISRFKISYFLGINTFKEIAYQS